MAMEQNLFGPSVSDIRNQMAQADAQWGNNLTSTGLAASIGGMAGRGIGGLIGLEDPREAEAKQVQEAVAELRQSGVDMSDPAEYFKKMAGIFGARGLTKQAEMAAAKALEYQTKKEERDYKKELHGIDRDTKIIGLEKAYVDLAKARAKAAGKLDGEEFLSMLDKLYKDASVESKTKAIEHFNNTGDANAARKMLETKREDKAEGTTPEGYLVYRDPGKTPYIFDPETGQKRDYFGPVKPVGGITNDLRTESAANNSKHTIFVEGYKKHSDEMAAVRATESSLQTMRRVIDSGKLTTGTLADKVTEVKRFAATLGASVPSDITDPDDLFDAMVTNVVLPRMKMLGGNDSEQELKVIREATGSRKFTLATLSQVLQVMEKAVARRKEIQEKYVAGRRRGEDINDFDWNEGDYVSAAKKVPPAGSLGSPKATPTPTPAPSPTGASTVSPKMIKKYKDYVKETTGRDVSDEEAIKVLEASRPRKK